MQKISLAQVDLYLFKAVYGLAKKSRILDFFAVSCAVLLPSLLIIVLFLAAFLEKKWELFLVPLFAALFARFFANEIIYYFYQRKRPPEVLPIQALIKKPDYPAFPSGHTAAFFALSFSLLNYHIALGIVFLSVSFFIGISRVFCGIHWPSDILGGIASGLVSFLAVWAVVAQA